MMVQSKLLKVSTTVPIACIWKETARKYTVVSSYGVQGRVIHN